MRLAVLSVSNDGSFFSAIDVIFFPNFRVELGLNLRLWIILMASAVWTCPNNSDLYRNHLQIWSGRRVLNILSALKLRN